MMKFLALILSLMICSSAGAQLVQNRSVTAVKMHTSSGSSAVFRNMGLAASVSSNALTIALKQADGSTNASSIYPVDIAFRSSTLTSGGFSFVSATGAISVVVSSGSTLGTTSGVDATLYVYAINNAGAIELAVMNGVPLDEGKLYSTTAEGGAGAADSANVLYSTTARTNVAVRLLGKIVINEGTAGTWATAATSVAIPPFKPPRRFAILEDQKSSGTAAGGVGSTGYQTRTLNTIASDPSNMIVSLTSNAFTLTPGRYWIHATAPSNGVNGNRIRLRNTTDSTTTLFGISQYSGADSTNRLAELDGEFTITANKTFEIQHYFASTQGTNGLGIAAGSGEVEVYTKVVLEKLEQ